MKQGKFLRITRVVLVLLVMFLFCSCTDMSEDEISSRMKGKLNKAKSYKVEGELSLNKSGEEPRKYSVRELFIAPDNIRVEVISMEVDGREGQVFISSGEEVVLYNPLLEEKYSLPAQSSLQNKFSHLFYEKLSLLAKNDFEIDKEGEGYKLIIKEDILTHEVLVSKVDEGILKRDIDIDEVNLYKGSNLKEPYLNFDIEKIKWNYEVDENLFKIEDPGEQYEKLEHKKEPSCEIVKTSIKEIKELDFEVYVVEYPAYEVFHIGACNESEQLSIKYTSQTSSDDLSFIQSKKDKGEERNGQETMEPVFIPSDYENVLRWSEGGKKYKLIGKQSRGQMLELFESVRNLEIN